MTTQLAVSQPRADVAERLKKGTVLEYRLRDGARTLVYSGTPGQASSTRIPDHTLVKFLDRDKQPRPILAFDLFLAGNEAIYSRGFFHFLEGEPFQFGSGWIGLGVKFEIT